MNMLDWLNDMEEVSKTGQQLIAFTFSSQTNASLLNKTPAKSLQFV